MLSTLCVCEQLAISSVSMVSTGLRKILHLAFFLGEGHARSLQAIQSLQYGPGLNVVLRQPPAILAPGTRPENVLESLKGKFGTLSVYDNNCMSIHGYEVY